MNCFVLYSLGLDWKMFWTNSCAFFIELYFAFINSTCCSAFFPFFWAYLLIFRINWLLKHVREVELGFLFRSMVFMINSFPVLNFYYWIMDSEAFRRLASWAFLALAYSSNLSCSMSLKSTLIACSRTLFPGLFINTRSICWSNRASAIADSEVFWWHSGSAELGL